MKVAMLLSLMLLAIPASTVEDDDFVPPGVEHAVAAACVVQGVDEGGDIHYAEAYVIVKYEKGPEKDYRPVIARRDVKGGGVPRAIEDCREWFSKVSKKIQAAKSATEASK